MQPLTYLETKTMTNVTIKFETDNAAFSAEHYGGEVARILRKLADEFENAMESDTAENCIAGNLLRDVNGNTIGIVQCEAHEPEPITFNVASDKCTTNTITVDDTNEDLVIVEDAVTGEPLWHLANTKLYR